MKKVSEQQLERLQEFDKNTSQIRRILGDITVQYEMQKGSLLMNLQEQQTSIEDIKKEISDEFGNVTVDLLTGEITSQE